MHTYARTRARARADTHTHTLAWQTLTCRNTVDVDFYFFKHSIGFCSNTVETKLYSVRSLRRKEET